YEIYPKTKDPDKNFLKILEFFRTERLNNKKIGEEQKSKYHLDLSESGKIAINSAYGMLNTAGLNFNDSEQAGKVTELGRQVLEKAIVWATGRSYEEWNPKKEQESDSEMS
ncbi:MAG: hypothetical protein HC836_45325, partial [Richelia sp. RM2_1_2]|nr:hypothetical protein [Richelia sp. RM2_1_2]